jgi:ribose transport system ATP-binding protein
MVQNISFQLKKGETLCFAGLMGAGRTEVARALLVPIPKHLARFGLMVRLLLSMSTGCCTRRIGYLSEEPQALWRCLGLSVAENSVLANLDAYSGTYLLISMRSIKLPANMLKSSISGRRQSAS